MNDRRQTDPPPGRSTEPDHQAVHDRTVAALLGVEVREATPDRVVMAVPVTWKVHQPFGILHGGVSALLAESAASYGGALSVPPGKSVVGIELNASHLRSMRQGTLVAVATPVRKGRTLQVWEVALTDEDGRDICRSRCTLAVVDHDRTPASPAPGEPPG